jgi:hypothetical protein
MIPKSGYRFSEKIMLRHELIAVAQWNRDSNSGEAEA